MKRIKWLWLWILFGILLIVFIPLAMDWLIIGNSFPSNIDNADWVGFLGGYIGSIIGAAVSLVGIVITIRYTNEQNQKDRELQVRPYCSIRYVAEPKTLTTRKQLGCLMIGCEPQENGGPRYSSVIYIKNIGMGPAIEFQFDVDDIDDGREHYLVLQQRTPETANNAVNLLQAGEEAIIPINIWFNFDPITSDDIEIIEDDPLGKYHIKPTVLRKYRNFTIHITVRYCDIYQNEYSQEITLASNMSALISHDGKAEHKCDVGIRETTTPIKIGKRKN